MKIGVSDAYLFHHRTRMQDDQPRKHNIISFYYGWFNCFMSRRSSSLLNLRLYSGFCENVAWRFRFSYFLDEQEICS